MPGRFPAAAAAARRTAAAVVAVDGDFWQPGLLLPVLLLKQLQASSCITLLPFQVITIDVLRRAGAEVSVPFPLPSAACLTLTGPSGHPGL